MSDRADRPGPRSRGPTRRHRAARTRGLRARTQGARSPGADLLARGTLQRLARPGRAAPPAVAAPARRAVHRARSIAILRKKAAAVVALPDVVIYIASSSNESAAAQVLRAGAASRDALLSHLYRIIELFSGSEAEMRSSSGRRCRMSPWIATPRRISPQRRMRRAYRRARPSSARAAQRG